MNLACYFFQVGSEFSSLEKKKKKKTRRRRGGEEEHY
jgi:hypothetical protein